MYVYAAKVLFDPTAAIYRITPLSLKAALMAQTTPSYWTTQRGIVGVVLEFDVATNEQAEAEFLDLVQAMVEPINVSTPSVVIWEIEIYGPDFFRRFGEKAWDILISDLRNDIDTTTTPMVN